MAENNGVSTIAFKWFATFLVLDIVTSVSGCSITFIPPLHEMATGDAIRGVWSIVGLLSALMVISLIIGILGLIWEA